MSESRRDDLSEELEREPALDPGLRPKPVLPPFAPPPPVAKRELERLLERIEREAEAFSNAPPMVAIQPCPLERVVVTIAVQEAPRVAVALASHSLILHAVNRNPPAGGVLTWRLPAPQGALTLPPQVNGATVALGLQHAGTETVEIEHVYQGIRVTDSTIVDVVAVRIQEAPVVALASHTPPDPSHTVTLHAHGVPGHGTYRWRITGAAARFQAGANVNAAQVTVESLQPGTATVEVEYQLGGCTVRDAIPVHVCSVAIQEGPEAAITRYQPGQVPSTLALHAVGTPGAGTFAWNIASAAVRFQGGANPGDVHQVTIEAADAGTVHVDVRYTVASCVVTDAITIDVCDVALNANPGPAIVLPLAGEPAGSIDLHAVGRPRYGRYDWILNPTNVVQFQGAPPGDVADATMAVLTTGTARVEVGYSVGNARATAEVDLHVVDVTLQQGPVAAVACHAPGAAANALQLDAVGVPAGGVYRWHVANAQDHLAFQGGHDPGNVAQLVLDTVTPGRSRVQVDYTFAGVTASASVMVHVVDVRFVQAGPLVMVHELGQPAETTPLQAVGNPAGGTFAWQSNAPDIADFQGGNPGNVAAVTLESVGGGNAAVQVQYSLHGATATATIACDVVSVSIQEAPPGGPNPETLLPFPGVAPATRALTAIGTPLGGTYAWNALHAGIAHFPNNANPGNQAAIQVEGVTRGTGSFRVAYTASGRTVRATAPVDVVPRCSRVAWMPRVPQPVGNQAVIQPQAGAACPHEAAQQRPHGPVGLAHGMGNGVATAAPAVAHHHGHYCEDCSAQHHGTVYHWIEPDFAGNQAASDALELRNQIQDCVTIYQNTYNATPGNRHVKANAADHAATLHVNNQNWYWLIGVQFRPFNTAFIPPAGARINKPKMFGVLRGQDSAGNAVRLRAISGTFPGVGSAQPNIYWSPPPPVPVTISNATRGVTAYPTNPLQVIGNTFGHCAATKLLTHALHLGLSIDSMAEIWVGRTQNNRVDGQFQASCDNCKIYIGRMICEQGGGQRTDAFPFVLPAPDPAPAPPNLGF